MIRTTLLAATLLTVVSAQYADAQTYKFKTVKDAGMNTSMHDINDSNVGVGGVFEQGATVRPCIVVKGKNITTLSDPNAVNGTECWGISSNGIIVGDYFDVNLNALGYIYSNGTFTDIVPPKSTYTVVYGVNASGVAIGYYLDSKGDQYGFLFDGTKYTKIKIKGGTTVEGFGINDAGNYTVEAILSDGFEHSYLYSGKTKTEIVFPNIQQVAAHHINNNGQISATIIDSNDVYYAGVYDPNANAYYQISDPKGTITIGDGINDSETLVGRYQDADDNSFGYIAKGKLDLMSQTPHASGHAPRSMKGTATY